MYISHEISSYISHVYIPFIGGKHPIGIPSIIPLIIKPPTSFFIYHPIKIKIPWKKMKKKTCPMGKSTIYHIYIYIYPNYWGSHKIPWKWRTTRANSSRLRWVPLRFHRFHRVTAWPTLWSHSPWAVAAAGAASGSARWNRLEFQGKNHGKNHGKTWGFHGDSLDFWDLNGKNPGLTINNIAFVRFIMETEWDLNGI